jgi:O-antigen ligase
LILARAQAGSALTPTTNRLDIPLGATAAIATVGAMAADVPAAVLLIVIASLGLAVARPVAGLATLAILLPLRVPDALHPPGAIVLLIAAVTLGWLLRLPFQREKPRVGSGAWALAAYVLLCAVAVPVGLSGGGAGEQMEVIYQFGQLVGLAALFVVARSLLEKEAITQFLVLLLGSAAFAACLGIFQFWWGGPAGIPFRGILSPAPDAEWLDRVAGPFTNTNYFAFLLASAIVVATGMFGRSRALGRVSLVAVSAIMAAALVLTFSRGAFIALLAGWLVLAWFRSRRLAIGLLLGFAVTVALAYPAFLAIRLDRTFGAEVQRAQVAEAESLESRESILATGLRLFLSEPVFGVGFGRFQFESVRFQGTSEITYAHNSYNQILAEQGLLGGGAALAVIAALAWALLRAQAAWRSVGAAALVMMLIGGLFLEVTTTIQATSLGVFVLAAALAGSAASRRLAPNQAAMDDIGATVRSRRAGFGSPLLGGA